MNNWPCIQFRHFGIVAKEYYARPISILNHATGQCLGQQRQKGHHECLKCACNIGMGHGDHRRWRERIYLVVIMLQQILVSILQQHSTATATDGYHMLENAPSQDASSTVNDRPWTHYLSTSTPPVVDSYLHLSLVLMVETDKFHQRRSPDLANVFSRLSLHCCLIPDLEDLCCRFLFCHCQSIPLMIASLTRDRSSLWCM